MKLQEGSERGGPAAGRGFALVEVLFVSAILATTLVGLALFLGHSQSFVSGEGDERAALYLAEQMMEQQVGQLRGVSATMNINEVCLYTAANPGNCSNFLTTQYSQTTCAPGDSDPACTSLTLTTPVGWGGGQAATLLSYQRFTCIQWVDNTTLSHATDGTPRSDCPCTSAGTATLTKRICVKVTSKNPQARTVVIRTVLTSQPAS